MYSFYIEKLVLAICVDMCYYDDVAINSYYLIVKESEKKKMKTVDFNLSYEEIEENLNCLSKAELLDIVYDETFNNAYDEMNSKFKMNHNALIDNANTVATKALESVEHMSCNELVEYIKNEFM